MSFGLQCLWLLAAVLFTSRLPLTIILETGVVEEDESKSQRKRHCTKDVLDTLGVEGYRYYFMTDVTPW